MRVFAAILLGDTCLIGNWPVSQRFIRRVSSSPLPSPAAHGGFFGCLNSFLDPQRQIVADWLARRLAVVLRAYVARGLASRYAQDNFAALGKKVRFPGELGRRRPWRREEYNIQSLEYTK
ncbi:MAG: hypothetical protein KAR37_17200 [Alphaproteobacteria bacterium]|nr:hypothetical protein [Alphaproteobacteria bacterium]